MPITVTELAKARRLTDGNRPSAERVYLAIGSDDESAIYDAVNAASPASITTTASTLIKSGLLVEEISDEAWLVTGEWSPNEFQDQVPEEGDSVFSFDTTGGTQKVTQSIETVAGYSTAGGAVPAFNGSIGVSPDGSVEGVDITVPVYQWTETHYLSAATVNSTYKAALFAATGTVNDATFKGTAAGETLFLGARGSQRGDGDWEIEFRFASLPNKTNFDIGDPSDPITVTSKKGWEYLWVYYDQVEDTTAGIMVAQPIAAMVEKVYEDGDFSTLGIGTT